MTETKKVIGFGTFDGLHPGHLSYLHQLKRLGDELVVVVARDRNVEKIKGRAPKQAELERQSAVQTTRLADEVILGNETNFYQCLLDHRPDVIGLGYDQRANIQAIKEVLPGVEIVRLEAFEPKRYKSSLLSEVG